MFILQNQWFHTHRSQSLGNTSYYPQERNHTDRVPTAKISTPEQSYHKKYIFSKKIDGDLLEEEKRSTRGVHWPK